VPFSDFSEMGHLADQLFFLIFCINIFIVVKPIWSLFQAYTETAMSALN